MPIFRPAFLFALYLCCTAVYAQNEQGAYSYYEEAVIEFNQGDYEASYIHLKNALNEDDDHLPSKILMGRLLLINNLPEAAITEFEEALMAGADPNIVMIPLVRTYIFVGEFTKAVQVDLKHLSNDNRFEIFMLQASAYRNLDNTELAFTLYQKARLLQPNTTRILNSIASLYMAGEVWGKALENIETSLAIDNTNPKTIHLHGHFLMLQGDLVQAEQKFEQAYKAMPNNPIFQRSLASIYLRNNKRDDAFVLLQQINAETPDAYAKLMYAKMLKGDDAGEATKLYQEVANTLSLVPEDVITTRTDLALINALSAYYQENYEQAATDLERYLEANPTNINALKLITDSLIKLNRYQEASRILEKHEVVVKNNMPLTVSLCNLYFELQRGFKCESIIRELRVVMQDEATLDLLEVRSLNNRGASKEALALFEEHFSGVEFPFLRQLHVELLLQNNLISQARQIIDSQIELASAKGQIPYEVHILNTMVLMQEGELVAALREVDNVFVQQPNSAAAMFLRAQILHHLGRYDDSIALLAKINPQYSPVQVAILRSSNLQAKGMLDDAETILKGVYEQNNKNASVLENLMQLYKAKKDYKNALWANQRLQKTSFLNVNYMLEQAHIYLLANQLENAVVTFEKIAKLVKDDPNGLINLAQLQHDAQMFDHALKNIRKARSMLNRKDAIDMQARVLQATIMYRNQQWTQALALARSVVLDTYTHDELRILKLQSMFIVAEIYMLQSRFESAAELFVELFSHGMPNQVAPYLYQIALDYDMPEYFTQAAEALLQKQPEQTFVRRLLGDYYTSQSEQEKAMRHYTILANTPGLPKRHEVLNNMANIVLESDLTQAESLIEEAFGIEEFDAHIIDTMGWIEFKKGNYLAALKHFRKAYVLDSTDPGIKFHLAYVLVKLNRADEAKNQLDRLFAEHKEFPQKERAEALRADIQI